jgi:hypothetical protein
VPTGGTVSLDNYYTKTQIDASLATKENVSDFNLTLLNYYTKTDKQYVMGFMHVAFGSVSIASAERASSSSRLL